ncbi:MAG: hypothetical protein CME70_19440 [Halobacteriovorax sp.]|nr:hypothetical protein [Halobacteriovorax sp.]MBK26181.1 hypothetical protein [Halobacteriovorax sp.]|tara:strand:+ start:1322 stop:1543 length:222 start_codon:yes stop_codon:yes gene_type:complete
MPKKKKVPWTEDQWHTINSALSYMKFKSLDKLSYETGIDESMIKLIIEDFAQVPYTVVRRGKSYKYYNAADCR